MALPDAPVPQRAAEPASPPAGDETRNDRSLNDATPAPPIQPAAAFPATAPQLPEQFGRYRIRHRLGRGGMGTVYLADDTELHRPVAIKVPSAEACTDPETVERFFREARAAAALRHPNICPVYDVGRIDGTLYLTMAYIDGRTLHDVLRESNPPPAEAAALVRKLALALEVAHRHGLLHRDLKPSNVMIDAAGEPVVMDFGLVRNTESEAHLTRSGVVLGTPAYMAPEQALSQLGEMGPPTDVYSTGVILYQMLAGRLPFVGNTHGLLLQAVSEPPPPPSQFRPGLDGQLEAICLKALAKKPAERFPSMADLAAALESFSTTSVLSGTTIRPAPSSLTTVLDRSPRGNAAILPRKSGVRWKLVAVLLLVASLVPGIALLVRHRDGADPAQNVPATIHDAPRSSPPAAPAQSRASGGATDGDAADLLEMIGDSSDRPREKKQRPAGRAVEAGSSATHGRE